MVAATWEIHPKITFESLAPEFKSNPTKAWRNYGSVVSSAVEAALRDPNVVIDHINTTRLSPWDDGREKLHPWFRGLPGRRYFVHFDMSKNRDATGVALVHRERTGAVVVDFMLKVKPRVGANINYSQLRDLLYDIAGRGFHIQLVTYDQWQSEETRQVLEEKGYATDRESADKDTEAYDTLIELLMNGRLDYYAYRPFIEELEELRLLNGVKYDHPKKNRRGDPGSKDVSDAVACATKRAIQYELDNPPEPPGQLRVIRSSSTYRQRYGETSMF